MSIPSLTVRNGSIEAHITLANINNRMSYNQTAEAERLVAEWKSGPAECEVAISLGSQCPVKARNCRQRWLSITSALTLKAAIIRDTCLRQLLTLTGHPHPSRERPGSGKSEHRSERTDYPGLSNNPHSIFVGDTNRRAMSSTTRHRVVK
jgi:hypothetical protein